MPQRLINNTCTHGCRPGLRPTGLPNSVVRTSSLHDAAPAPHVPRSLSRRTKAYASDSPPVVFMPQHLPCPWVHQQRGGGLTARLFGKDLQSGQQASD